MVLLVSACVGVGSPGFTIPPINIPSFGPITLPTGGIDLPPGVFPSADANSGVCLLVTPAEMSSIWGSQATVTANEGSNCTYTFSNISSVNLQTDAGDLQTAKLLFGASAKDITVGSYPAVSGVFIGQPAIYIQNGSNQLQVLGILTGSDEATQAKLLQTATLAASRWH